MEAIGIPWFMAVRHLGPPLLLLAVGGALLVWRRPARPGLVWAALGTNLGAAALPYLWIGLQLLTDQAERTVYGLVLTLVQPGVATVAWLLLLAAALTQGADGSGRGGEGATGGSGKAERTHENIG
ncbi:hypothetical protein HNR06_000307 [Nocardiopsis arvandica]|uniref:Uncharacterized protein n=1 Tax=Nocardiopsis sinuspersici TaxID=501010 RepID=A0A7Z0BGN1_9ACTN|nr:hypothetical protein [Nocardiopsis sinuspersici]NYH50718.1 hypothetical protein [Nocardiopsis sinuspersici]